VAVHAVSNLFKDGRLQIMLDFPSPRKSSRPTWTDFSTVTGHQTDVIHRTGDRLEVNRTIDDAHYQVALAGTGFTVTPARPRINFSSPPKSGNDTIDLTCRFGPTAASDPMASAHDIETACADWWPAFWKSGGAIDLSAARTRAGWNWNAASSCRSTNSPCNQPGIIPRRSRPDRIDPWASKWHFEMDLVALAHYALWDRWSMADKALMIYQHITPVARPSPRTSTTKA